MIEPHHSSLSVQRQCSLVSLPRSSYYYQSQGDDGYNLHLMRLIDERPSDLETPWYGSRQMARHLRRQGHEVGRKRVRRLMAKIGVQAVYQKPKTSQPVPPSNTP